MDMNRQYGRRMTAIGIALCMVCGFIGTDALSGDVWFMLSQARGMLARGLSYPVDTLTMHELPFFTQKWAMCCFVHRGAAQPGIFCAHERSKPVRQNKKHLPFAHGMYPHACAFAGPAAFCHR